jgi:hypothetical protein
MGEDRLLKSSDRVKVTKNFYLDEFVDYATYMRFLKTGKKHYALRFIRNTMITTAQKYRDTFGPCVINNWAYTQNPANIRQWSGYRSEDSPNYSETSAHSFGDAIDCVFSKVTAEEARGYIKNNRDAFPFVTRLEKDVTWLHSDGIYTGQYNIVEFNPPR